MNSAFPAVTIDWKASYVALSTALVSRREALGMTQDHLREQLGISRRTLQRWEAGEVEPPAKRLFQWAAALGVSIAPDVAQSGTAKVLSAEATSRVRRDILGLSAEAVSRVRQDILGLSA